MPSLMPNGRACVYQQKQNERRRPAVPPIDSGHGAIHCALTPTHGTAEMDMTTASRLSEAIPMGRVTTVQWTWGVTSGNGQRIGIATPITPTIPNGIPRDQIREAGVLSAAALGQTTSIGALSLLDFSSILASKPLLSAFGLPGQLPPVLPLRNRWCA